MANLAQIQSIAQGQFFVKDSLGNLTELKVGDTVSLNDTIVAASSNTDLSKIEILFDTNELITLSQGEQLLDTTLLASTFGNEELAFDKQEVDETLNAWNNAQDGDATDMETAAGDVTEQATNAGDERAADGGALRSKFNSRDGSSTDVRSDLRDGDFDGGNPETPQEQIPTELLNPVGTTTPTIPVDTRVPASVITLSDPTVDEGNQITITATVTNPPQTDLIITLSNGKTTQTITISAGETTGSVTFDNPNGEDVYIDNSTETYTITGTTGGNYVSLDTSDKGTVTVNDTTTTGTKITVSDVTVSEGGTASVGVSVNADTKVDLVVTLDAKDANGNNIQVTIPAGTPANTVITSPEFVINNAEDVYVDGSSFEVGIVSTNNDATQKDNFEALDTSDKGTVTVNDTTTTGTKITVSDVTVSEGGTASVGVSVNADTKVDLVVTLDAKDANGNNIQVTIPAGTPANTVITSPEFVINNAEDVYVDGSSFEVGIVSTNNDATQKDNFEALDTSDKGTVTVNDTTTTGTKITVSDVTVSEGGTASVGVSVNADTKVDLVVTLDAKDANGNNIQVTIPAGTPANTVITSPEFVINNAEDVYVDGSSFEVGIVSTNNDATQKDNFEALDTSDKGTVTVNDTTTTGTKITVSDVTVSEGGTASVGVSVNADTKVDLVVTLDAKDANGNNIQVTIPAGTPANTVITSPEFVINNAEDVYVDGSSFEVGIVSTNNDATQKDNFEALDTSDKGTVTVNDTTTTGTKITVSDVTVSEGGTASVGVSVNADTKVDLVVTLDAKDANGNNIQVTIPAGTPANTVITSPEFVINNAEDVYVDGSSFEVGIVSTNNDATQKDNFEALDTSDKGTVTVNDTTTTGTKITVSDVTVSEGGTASVGVSVNADTKVDLVVTLDAKDANGNNIQVTIPAGTPANTVITSPEFVINNAEDVYVDGSSFEVGIVSTNNDATQKDNFEALDTSDKGTVTVNDTTTTGTKITVSDVTVSEGGTASVGVSVNADTKVDLVVTLDAKDANGNNIQVTIPAGTPANTVITSPEFVINNAEDVYVDGSSFEVGIVSTNNDATQKDNFEALDTSDKGTVTVNDTTTTGTKITVSDVTVSEGGTASVGVSVNADTKVDLVVTLDAKDANGNNIQVTIPAGTPANTVITSPEFVINNAEDVYVDGSSFEVGIVSTNNDATQKDNFEALDTSDKGTVTVNDTTTTGTKITVSDVTVSEGGTASVGVSVNADTKVDLVVTLDAKDANGNNIQVTIPAGTPANTVITSPEFVINNAEDVYVDGSSFEVGIVSTNNDATQKDNFEALDTSDKGTVTVNDTTTPIDVTITATVTTPKIIDVNTKLDGTTGVKITGINSDGEEVDLSIITGTNHDGFGIDGKNLSNGDTKELGVGEKIVVEFTDGKDVNSLDVSFAWRNNHETAKLTFVKDGQVVGYATVDGDGSSTTKAIVKYYDENNNLIKTQEAEGSSDRVDKAFTFELPDSNGGIVSFDKVEFSAPQNKDDYLINKIVYKEVLNPEVTDIVTNGGDITFNIQVDENYPPQGTATATVEVNGKEYSVELNSTGRGTLTIDSKELGDLSNIIAKVTEVKGGNYEKVNPTEASFNFTPTLKSTDDNISIDEDVSYTLKVTDFGEVSSNTKEFKITELPTNGKLFLSITVGDTIFNPDGTQTVATEDIKVEITKDQIVTLGQVGAGKIEFVPNLNSDEDGSFKFQVGDGNKKFSTEYTTTIDVKAVADAPTVSIDITKIGATTIVVDGNGNESNSSGIKALDILKVNPNYNGQETIDNDYSYSGNDDITKNYQNLNGGATNIITDKGNDTLEFQSLNSKNINSGAGDDKVIINQSSSSSNIQLGEGNNSYTVAGSLNSGTTQSGAGNDTLIVNQGASNTVINLGDGNNTISIGEALNNSNISTGSGNDTLIVGQASDNNTISTGGGNDFVQLNHNVQGTKIDLGTGNDGIRLSNEGHVNFNTETLIDGGADFDTLYLNGKETDYWIEDANHNKITYSQYVQENKDINGYANKLFYIYEVDGNGTKQGSGFKIKNVEDIVFEKDAPKEVIIKAVEYKVDISAALTDKDGSETLSVVIKNVPAGAILESNKYEILNNVDGSYTVKILAGIKDISDSLTMKVPQSYKGEINLEIEAKATETNDNVDGNNFATATANDTIKTVTMEPFKAELDMELSSVITNTITTKDVNTVATEQAGIKLGADGKYYETKVVSKTEKIVDNEALKDLTVKINGKEYTGITVGADGKYYVIDNTIAKEQKTIEVEREVTKTVSLTEKQVESFMIEVTKETKGIVLGKEVTDLGKNETIDKNSSKTYTLEQPTSNIEIKLASGSGKIEFVDKNGKVIGSSTTQTGTDSKGYSVPKDAVGVKITATNALKMDAIKYHVDPHEETVQVGGKILDVEGMQKAGISWNSTVSEKQVQTQDITKLGSTVGDGNIKGFNPEAKANSQVFDFGKDKAFQKVIIEVDATISGTWNFNKNSTKDVFVVSANGVPQGAYNFSSNQDYSSQSDFNKNIGKDNPNGFDVKYVNGTLSQKYTYEVYLDENGKAQMNFTVASTNTDEWVTITEVRATYDGLSGFVQTKTEIEKVTETIFVGVPTNVEYKGELPTKEITKYETVQIETTPIYTKITQYEYELDLSASITVGSGQLSTITLKDIPSGVTIKGYEANEDGSYTIKIGEDGKSQLTLVSDSLLSDAEKKAINATVEANSEDGSQSSEIKVNIEGDISHSIKALGTEDNDDISINTENSTSIDIDGGAGYDTIKLEENNDIDFSNLGNLIKNIEAIDLTDGNHKLTNITLDDVLKMSGDDNKIKITGDEFDSVTFKNTIGQDGQEQNWSKTSGEGVDKGFDIYVNSGDPTLQVKVEQPISDGITS
ncbi:beta strand repeat-containing protein [Aliarcobacter cryaerophilus]|uniref:beta strand repeat-containing protein n=1 Tax=Aliarcobacter cryaerophilus TaxID=28198 RepID=UPI0013DE176C|nr:immunoglobulin-like domain-containing protein [Aliarcobacter cryaerophilus]